MLLTFAHMQVFASSCGELELDLVSVENAIQNSKLALCDDDNRSPSGYGNCRAKEAPSDHPDNRYFHQLQNESNRALAKLILDRGITAIGAAIEGSNNSLRKLNSTQLLQEAKLDKASSTLDILETNLSKANILQAAMTPTKKDENNTSFWNKYNFTSSMGLNDFIVKMEEVCLPDNVANNEEGLCQELNKVQHQEDYKLDSKNLEMLYGFAVAEMKSRYTDDDPIDYYGQLVTENGQEFYKGGYLERLNIKVKEKVDNGSGGIEEVEMTYSPQKFHEKYFGAGKKLSKLKNAINDFNKPNGKSKLNAQRVFSYAADLDEINVNYGGSENISAVMNSQFNKHFEKASNDIRLLNNVTDTVITDVWKNNLDDHSAKLKSDYEVMRVATEEEIINEINYGPCKRSSDPIQCVREACGWAPGEVATCENENLKSKVSTNLFSRLQEMDQMKRVNDILARSNTCFAQENENLAKKKECLEGIRSRLNQIYPDSPSKKLENTVAENNARMIEFANSAPFRDLNQQKLLIVNALKKKNCQASAKSSEISCLRDVNASVDQKAIQLTGDLADISIALDNQAYNRALGKSVDHDGQREFLELRNKLEQDCSNFENNTNLTPATCEYYAKLRSLDNARIAEQKESARRQADRASRSYSFADDYEEPETGKAFLRGLGYAAVQLTPGLVFSWAEYDQTKQWHKSSMRNIQRRTDFYNDYQDYLTWRSDIGMDQQPASMWANSGYGFYNTTYGYESNFQGGNAGQIYTDPSDLYQLNIPNAQIIDNGFGTGGSSTDFSFSLDNTV